MGDGIGDFAFWLAVGFAALGIFFGPVGKALGRWIESAAHRQDGGSPEVEQRLQEFERMGQRIGELEERLDFTERMLAQQREPSRLGAGEHQ